MFKLDTIGKETVLYSFNAIGGGQFPVAGLIRDAAGFGCAIEVTRTVTDQRGEGIRAVRGWTVKRVEYGKSLGLKPA